MTNNVASERKNLSVHDVLPKQRGLYYGGEWHEPLGGYGETVNPATGESLGRVAEANSEDIALVVESARSAFTSWRHTLPRNRGAVLRKMAEIVREHGEELALIDAANCGNPVSELMKDINASATFIDVFAGLVLSVEGSTMPMGEGVVNLTHREPVGVCARLLAYNHPLLFFCAKFAPAVVAGNSVIMKPPQQAPLSAYRLMELWDGILPPGVLNLVAGGVGCGEALTQHPEVPIVTLIGSVPTARAVMRGAAERLKSVIFELGGKNAMVVYPDADIEKAIAGAVKGMNFGWGGQSCGSTSRLFLHSSIYDQVLEGVIAGAKAFNPGIPTDPSTTMGSLISKSQFDKVMGYIKIAKDEGARLVFGGESPSAPELANGFFVEPTIFADVTADMRIAQEEVFGPVLSVLRWDDEEQLFEDVNSVEYGLTGSIYTTSLANAHRASAKMEAGYIWVNNSSMHFPGVPFGGFKMSGIGREESIDELHEFTQLKNVNITL